MVEVTIPPTIGAAMGFITSEPMPDSHRIGARLRNHGSHRHQFGTQALNRAFDGLDPAKNGLRGLPSQG